MMLHDEDVPSREWMRQLGAWMRRLGRKCAIHDEDVPPWKPDLPLFKRMHHLLHKIRHPQA